MSVNYDLDKWDQYQYINKSKFDRVLSDRMNHLNEFQSLQHVHFPHEILVAVAMVVILAVQMLLLFDNNFDDPVLLALLYLYHRLLLMDPPIFGK